MFYYEVLCLKCVRYVLTIGRVCVCLVGSCTSFPTKLLKTGTHFQSICLWGIRTSVLMYYSACQYGGTSRSSTRVLLVPGIVCCTVEAAYEKASIGRAGIFFSCLSEQKHFIRSLCDCQRDSLLDTLEDLYEIPICQIPNYPGLPVRTY